MISFSCARCGRQLKVKEELAGKKVRCPQCQQPVEVPALASTLEDATVPPRSPGVSSNDVTLPPAASLPPSTPTAAPATPLTQNRAVADIVKSESAYEVGDEIARGGMGAILRAVDQDIRREVAVKFLLNASDEKQKARFVEEAQITGQLEHPNIVPIHQLGVHADGRCFFSMKMVKGRSLAEILKDEGNDYTLGRLLTIFVSICNAMAYAHSRQVIHRDLKPANIMVGDFGEVYVMDWGLAKVQDQRSEVRDQRAEVRGQKAEGRGQKSGMFSRDPKGSAGVATARSANSDLTQAGSVMGTPAYMPPEQAQGSSVDERADIYSLGAILYEIMTLSPPVGRGGDMVAILMRVVEGEIEPPEKRAPERAKAGWIAPELAAIAMQALAKDATDRYQTVVAVQRDIELYLEGRSVSAKQDSAWEMFKKLVRRNKGVSIATAAALLVLAAVAGVFLKINYDARVLAEHNYDAFVKEQEERRKQGLASIPTYVTAARLLMDKRDFAGALRQLRTALDFDPEHGESRYLRGQLLMIDQKFDQARPDVEAHCRQHPDEPMAKDLLDFLPQAKSNDIDTQIHLSEIFSQHLAYAQADGALMSLGENTLAAQKKIRELYSQRIDAAWPGKDRGKRLQMDAAGRFTLNLHDCKEVTDLTPLRGMRLTTLNLDNCEDVRDLQPLVGMPLFSLSLSTCKVKDLTPLKDLPLTRLNLAKCAQINDLSPIKYMKLKSLSLPFIADKHLESLESKTITSLSLAYNAKVRDLTPLQALPLTYLDLFVCTQVRDLTPLTGMKLKVLNMDGCSQVRDLTPLVGMPLIQLSLFRCDQVRDLTPLQGMPLTNLSLGLTLMEDANLKALTGLTSLEVLDLRSTRVTDAGLKELTGLTSLTTLGVANTQVTAAGVAELQKALPRCKITR